VRKRKGRLLPAFFVLNSLFRKRESRRIAAIGYINSVMSP
jgi:hypothetical protein